MPNTAKGIMANIASSHAQLLINLQTVRIIKSTADAIQDNNASGFLKTRLNASRFETAEIFNTI